MTPEQLSAMTLGDLEAMATRLDAAARTIRDAMSLMGGSAPVNRVSERDNAILAASPLMGAAPAVQWTPEELAVKARLKAQREAAEAEAERAVLEAAP